MSHPRSQVVDLGGSATFSVFATGSGLTYEWFRDGVSVGSNASLTVNNAQYANAGLYHVHVTDASGTALDSAQARLHVNSSTPPTPYAYEVNGNTSPTVGEFLSFSASIYMPPSPGPVHYQWRKNGIPIPDKFDSCTTSDEQTFTAVCTIGPVAAGDAGEYSVVFTNDYWKVASSGVSIAIVDESWQPVPMVTITPTSVHITNIHSQPTLPASAAPSFTPTCQQWYQTDSRGGTYFKQAIPNATDLPYTFPDPVTYDSLGLGYFMIEVFDQDHVPHPSSPVHVYGVCQ